MRILVVLPGWLVIGWSLLVASEGALSEQPVQHCGRGDVTSIAQAGQQASVQLALGKEHTGLADAVLRCQARLYDDNGPEIPHVWCEDDLFLLGISIFDNYKLAGLPRRTVADFLEQVINEVSWSSDWGNEHLFIKRTATKDVVHPSFGHLLVFHDYTILGEPTLLPGDYTWEWTQKHPIGITPENPEGILFVGNGQVEIVSHEEHLLRVSSGTW